MALIPHGPQVEVDLVTFARRTLVEDGLPVKRHGAVAADLEAVVRRLVPVALERKRRS